MNRQEVIDTMRAQGLNAYERIVPEPQGCHVPAEVFWPHAAPDWRGEPIAPDTVRDARPYCPDGVLYAWRFCTITDPEWRKRWGLLERTRARRAS